MISTFFESYSLYGHCLGSFITFSAIQNSKCKNNSSPDGVIDNVTNEKKINMTKKLKRAIAPHSRVPVQPSTIF